MAHRAASLRPDADSADIHRMARSRPMLGRLLTVAALAACFVVMASVFAPGSSSAHDPLAPAPRGRSADTSAASTDPQEGLKSLGSVHAAAHRVDIHATSAGPRYSVYDEATGQEQGALLSLEQLKRYFPAITIESVDFSADGALMMADSPSLDFMP